MSLRAVGGKLLAIGNKLLAACCEICIPPDLWCNTTKDECGNPVSSCGPLSADTTGACTESCVPPTDPCECGPDSPCPLCYECVERKCVQIEDCCADGTPCPPCQKCVNGQCVPCGPCEQCIDGTCVPCEPCQKCVDGVCVECGANEVCVNGVCVPRQYYCCYDSPESSSSGGAARTTSCRPATLTPNGQQNPCQYGAKSGPHNSALLCEQNCNKFKCAPDACGNNRCIPDPEGPYESYNACLAACDDPCNMPCSFAGASAPGIYSIDGCERDICVSYSSTNGRPIRVQIYGPIVVDGCPQPGTRVVKVDSEWRCEECCDCPETPPRSNDPRDCAGGGKGQVQWTKPDGVTSFEVAVLTACGAAYSLDIQACEGCDPQPDPGPCSCETDDDCAPDCVCCEGECVKKDDIPPGKCCGPCDEENPCPEGCACVDGKCATPCQGPCPCPAGCNCCTGGWAFFTACELYVTEQLTYIDEEGNEQPCFWGGGFVGAWSPTFPTYAEARAAIEERGWQPFGEPDECGRILSFEGANSGDFAWVTEDDIGTHDYGGPPECLWTKANLDILYCSYSTLSPVSYCSPNSCPNPEPCNPLP